MASRSLLAKLSRDLRREASWLRDVAHPRPREVLIETTRACNLRCFHCAVGEPGYQGGTLSWEAFERILPFLRRHRPLVHLNGHGETLLHGRFVDMFRAVVETGCTVGFQTNGMLLTPALVRTLLDAAPAGRFTYLRVSVDAAEKELFDRIRIRGDFDTVRGNLLFLQEEKARRGSAAPALQIESCAMLLNVHQLPDLVRFAHEMGAGELWFSDIIEYARARGQRLHHDPERAVPHLLNARELAAELGVTLSIMPELRELIERAAARRSAAATADVPGPPATVAERAPVATPPPAATGEGAPAARVRDCRDPWRLAFVEASGNVMPCCAVALPMGNVAETSLDEIWNGSRYRHFRRMLASRSPMPQCTHCIMRAWAPMPLAARASEAISDLRQWRAAGGSATTGFSVVAEPLEARPGGTVTVGLVATRGAALRGVRIDVRVGIAESEAGGAYLDGRGLTRVATPLLVDWKPLAPEPLTLASVRVPLGWRSATFTLVLTATRHGVPPPPDEPPLARSEITIAVAHA